MMIDEFECYIPLRVEARARRAGLVSRRQVIEKVNLRLVLPASFARNPNDFVLSSFEGSAGIPPPPVSKPRHGDYHRLNPAKRWPNANRQEHYRRSTRITPAVARSFKRRRVARFFDLFAFGRAQQS